MRRKLPPIAALKAFDVAANHSSFKAAADDISLSPSAISHQIRSLEEYLGFQLFIREKGFVRLTDKGRVYHNLIEDIFDRLENSTREFQIDDNECKIVINLFHSFLSSWLYDRLPDFYEKYPNIELSFISSDNPPDYDKFKFDLAIYFGKAPLANTTSVALMDDYLTMVCSPEMAKELPQKENTSDLEQFSFLHCSCETKEWEIWFNSFDQPCPRKDYYLSTNDRSLVLKGAVDNMGIAIGRQPYMDRYLKSGELVVPYNEYIDTGYKYYLTYAKILQQNKNIIYFQNWLLDQCKALTMPRA